MFKIKLLLTFTICGSLLSACSLMPESVEPVDLSAPPFTAEQRVVLIKMLKNQKDNNESIQQWRRSQAGVVRLLAIETELKMLIEQLNELADESQFVESKSDNSSEKQIAVEQVKTEMLVINSETQGNDSSSYSTKLEENNSLTGLIAIQLSAMSNNEAISRQWQRLVKAYPAILGDLSPTSELVERSKGAIYRLKVGPFDNKSQAMSRCNKLRTVNVSCVTTQYFESAVYLPIN
jgi:cell division protein FtsN